jgi:osmotically-inducible protein OsmY
VKHACALLALAVALLQGCELAILGAGSAAAVSAIEDRRTTGTQLDDKDIEGRAGSRIDRFGDAAHVNVNAYNRSVLLTGEIPDERTREEIEKMVLGLPNVRAVTNDLQIAGTASLGARTNDSFITSKVKARFLDAKRFNPIHVKVVTEAGVVYLMGLVTEREADDAVDIARTTGGVRKVVKVFEYCKTNDELCRPRSAPEKTKPGS